MEIKISISADRIANLFTSAIESGDPVTTASRGGWCNGIDLKAADFPLGSGPSTQGLWWADPAFFADGVNLTIEVVEVDDEVTGHETTHTITNADIARGFSVLASKFPETFGLILEGDSDAPAADLFLQSMLFGEEKYA